MKSSFSPQERQREIYVRGMGGYAPSLPPDFRPLEALVEKKLPRQAFAYLAGGAGEEITLRHNERAFHQWQIVPRMLRDVSERDTSIPLLGQKLPAPFLLAPIGVLELAHPQGDLAVGKAAAEWGVPFILSSQASHSMEAVASQMGSGIRWFQLYWSKSEDLVQSLVSRAEQSGASAIVVTLDTTMLGWRPRDLQQAFLPFLRGMGIAQYVSDPVFQQLLDRPQSEEDIPVRPPLNLQTIRNAFSLMRRYPGSFLSNVRSRRPLQAVRQFINIYSRPSLSWDDIPRLREYTSLPILLKGILHPDDARRAVDLGMDGLIVSNHGGRQVDGAIPSIQALPEIRDAVGPDLPILLDSGIRTGADAFKAIALGANAVCIGRPYAYGLALGGREGVAEVIKNFRADFELTMGLAGCRTIKEINRENLRY